jgi:hypothetical protein
VGDNSFFNPKNLFMVTITGYALRQTQEGKSFVSLELTGEVEMIQSSNTGRFYATARKCSISSSFTEEVAKTLVGKAIRGKIERVECEPYEFTVKATGEVILLAHTYQYSPEEQVVPQPAATSVVAM